jgi:hypothetical protein
MRKRSNAAAASERLRIVTRRDGQRLERYVDDPSATGRARRAAPRRDPLVEALFGAGPAKSQRHRGRR